MRLDSDSASRLEDPYKRSLGVPRLFLLPIAALTPHMPAPSPQFGCGQPRLREGGGSPLVSLLSVSSPCLWSSRPLSLPCFFVVLLFLSALGVEKGHGSQIYLRCCLGGVSDSLSLTVQVTEQVTQASWFLNPSS